MAGKEGGLSHTFVVCELGGIAEGDLSVMLRQIEAAAAAGADAVKAQWLSDPAALVKRRRAEGYVGAYERLAYPVEWLGTLRDAAKARGLGFGCSVYLPSDAANVVPFVQFLKIASFENMDRELMSAVDLLNARVIISAGMGDRDHAQWLTSWRNTRRRFSTTIDSGYTWFGPSDTDVLHCCSAYPCPPESINLAVIRAYDLDGFSDHTANVLTGAFAVCAGARIVEFHLRLDDSNPANPDYVCALSPVDANRYVANIRLAERVMGDGVKACQPCEREMARYRVGVK